MGRSLNIPGYSKEDFGTSLFSKIKNYGKVSANMSVKFRQVIFGNQKTFLPIYNAEQGSIIYQWIWHMKKPWAPGSLHRYRWKKNTSHLGDSNRYPDDPCRNYPSVTISKFFAPLGWHLVFFCMVFSRLGTCLGILSIEPETNTETSTNFCIPIKATTQTKMFLPSCAS